MPIAIIQFPGSNCEAETLRAVRHAGMTAEEFLWNRNPADLKNFAGYVIVGGFSYEDRSRSGIIAALDPLIPYMRIEAEAGKPILGICNGAQILVETGLVPGLKNYAVGMALAENRRIQNGRVLGTGYYNAWTQMKLSVPPAATAFTRCLQPDQILSVPIAHGEGRFIIPTELLEEMKQYGLTTFRYCDSTGEINEQFPTNPNGAVYNLAAVTNKTGNVMAMMPHPERRPDMGIDIFSSMKKYIEDSVVTTIASLSYTPPPLNPPPYTLPPQAGDITTELIITDNEAKTVESTLHQLGIPASIQRFTHWEITTTKAKDLSAVREEIISSGELFNPNKERLIKVNPVKNNHTLYLLVRYRDDLTGQQKKQSLEQRFQITTIASLKKSSVWRITSSQADIATLKEKILATTIFYNQFSQECYIL